MSESLKSDVMKCKNSIPPVTKVVKGPATQAEKDEVISLYKEGVGVSKIAKLTGRAQSSISRWCGTSKRTSKSEFGSIIRNAGREHAITDAECTDDFDKEMDETNATILKAYDELRAENANAKSRRDYRAEFENAEKEPASAGTPTSSQEIKSTDSITLSEQNVNMAVEMLRLASATLDQIYKSDEFNSLNTGLAVGFGRAWGVIDMAVDMLNMEGE